MRQHFRSSGSAFSQSERHYKAFASVAGFSCLRREEGPQTQDFRIAPPKTISRLQSKPSIALAETLDLLRDSHPDWKSGSSAKRLSACADVRSNAEGCSSLMSAKADTRLAEALEFIPGNYARGLFLPYAGKIIYTKDESFEFERMNFGRGECRTVNSRDAALTLPSVEVTPALNDVYALVDWDMEVG